MGKGGVRQWLQQISMIGRATKRNAGFKDTACKALTWVKETPSALIKVAPTPPTTEKMENNVGEPIILSKTQVKSKAEMATKNLRQLSPQMSKTRGSRVFNFKRLNSKN